MCVLDIAAGFTKINTLEGIASIIASALAGFLSTHEEILLIVVLSIFGVALLWLVFFVHESLPLANRNIKLSGQTANKNVADENAWYSKCSSLKLFITTMRDYKIIYYIAIFYFVILFAFLGITDLVSAYSSILYAGDATYGVLFFVSIGRAIGNLFNPCVLRCMKCCCHTTYVKLIAALILLLLSILLMCS